MSLEKEKNWQKEQPTHFTLTCIASSSCVDVNFLHLPSSLRRRRPRLIHTGEISRRWRYRSPLSLFPLPIASWHGRSADAGETPETRSFCSVSFCFFIHLYTCVSFSRWTSVSLNHQSKRLMPCLEIVTGRVCSKSSSSSSALTKKMAGGSCYGGNERKHLSMKSHGHKSLCDTMDITPFHCWDRREEEEENVRFNRWGKTGGKNNTEEQKKKESKKGFTLKKYSFASVAHLVTFNHFARRHTWERRALTSFLFSALFQHKKVKKKTKKLLSSRHADTVERSILEHSTMMMIMEMKFCSAKVRTIRRSL